MPLEAPVDLVWFQGKPVVTMRSADIGYANDPFWHQTVARCRGRVRLLKLDDVPDPPSDPAPAGFLFHMTRCGSTLACRMLQATQRIRILSEPTELFTLLAQPGQAPQLLRSRLRKLLSLYLTGLSPCDEPLVVKWLSGCNRFIAQIEEAFPRTPKVIIVRDPEAVLWSCLEGPPQNWRAVPLEGFAPGLVPPTPCSFLERMARYVGSVLSFALDARELSLLQYPDLVRCVPTALAEHFQLGLTAEERKRMGEASAFYSKDAEGRTRFDAGAEALRRPRQATIERGARELIHPALARLLGSASDLGAPTANRSA